MSLTNFRSSPKSSQSGPAIRQQGLPPADFWPARSESRPGVERRPPVRVGMAPDRRHSRAYNHIHGGFCYCGLTARRKSEPRLQIILKPDQGEAERDRLEVFAIREPVGAKPSLEYTAHYRNEGTAAGKEHA